jgi:hypothetical protein
MFLKYVCTLIFSRLFCNPKVHLNSPQPVPVLNHINLIYTYSDILLFGPNVYFTNNGIIILNERYEEFALFTLISYDIKINQKEFS